MRARLRGEQCRVSVTTGLVHPYGVCRDAGEDGGLLLCIAPHTRHKASYAMDIEMIVDYAVKRASEVTLEWKDRNNNTEEH